MRTAHFDCIHFLGQLYISLQVTKSHAYSLFEIENFDAPPFLSKNSILLRSGQKSDLMSCLQTDSLSDSGEADVKLIDGASMHMVHTLGSDRIIKHSMTKVILFIWSLLGMLMSSGTSISDRKLERTRELVYRSTYRVMEVPKDWSSYFSYAANKTEMFQYLSRVISQSAFDGQYFFYNIWHNCSQNSLC